MGRSKEGSNFDIKPSKVSGDTTPKKSPPTVEQLAAEAGVTVERFMRDNYITGIEPPQKDVTIEGNK